MFTSAVFATMHDDIRTQFHDNDYTIIDIDGRQQPVFTFESNLSETRATILFLLDEKDSRLFGTMHKLAQTLPNVGLNTIVFAEGFANIQPSKSDASDNTAQSDVNNQALSQDTREEPTESSPSTDAGSTIAQSFAVTTTANAEQTDSNLASLTHCSEQLNNRISRLYDALSLSSQRTIILTSGLLSSCLFYIENIPGDALITINPFIDNFELNVQLSDKIASTSQPVLDLVNKTSNRYSSKNAVHRRISSQRLMKAHYRQRDIIGHRMSHRQVEYIAKEIYGWLTFLGY